MITALLSAKPRSRQGLLPLAELKSQIAKLSPDDLRGFWAAEIDPHRRTDPKWARSLDHLVERSLHETDVVAATVALALSLGTIAVFVSNPGRNVAFLVLPPFWLLLNLEPDGLEKTIATGDWLVPIWPIKRSRLVEDYCGYPLYVAEQTLREFERPPISESAARQAAAAVIQRYETMRKEDFIAEVRKMDDRINRERAKALWKGGAPAGWRKPGPKKTQMRQPN